MDTRTVLVTGASRGIGRAIAVRLARAGWHVYGGVRTQQAGQQLGQESDQITPVELDLTVPEHVAALGRELPDRLDGLVHNAAEAAAGPIETLSRAAMTRQFDVNVFGPLELTRVLLPRLRRTRGRLVFISSINGRVSFPFTGLYNASKFAIEAVADTLRVELGPFGVQVALIEPGVIDTEPWHEMAGLIDDLEARLDPQLRTLYAQHFAGERQLVEKIRQRAKPPELVAAAVERALTARRVRPRVLVGAPTRSLLLLKAVVPDRGLDAIWASGLGIERQPGRGSVGVGSEPDPGTGLPVAISAAPRPAARTRRT